MKIIILASLIFAGSALADPPFESATNGNPEAQCLVGYAYCEGVEVPRNYQMAFEWLAKSAAQSNQTAQLKIAFLFQTGTDVIKKNEMTYRIILNKLANENDSLAQLQIGLHFWDVSMQANELFVPGRQTNLVLAYKWLSIASAQAGNHKATAISALSDVEKSINAFSLRIAQTMAKDFKPVSRSALFVNTSGILKYTNSVSGNAATNFK